MVAVQSITSSFAGRYATALFDLAKETGAVDAVVADLAAFDALIDAHEDMQRFVRSPVFSAEDQVRALQPILDKIGVKGLAQKFLLLVATQRRLFAVRKMVAAFRQLVDQERGETDPAERIKILDTLQRYLREQVYFMYLFSNQMRVEVWKNDVKGYESLPLLRRTSLRDTWLDR